MIMSLFSTGIGIGTGPGVIQDHYSPTMGRHRVSPLFNGHIGNANASHQPQFEAGNKPFIKPNQVRHLFICFVRLFVCFWFINNNSRKQFLKGQNSPVFSHKQILSSQSKDMAPRFSKKGKLNADEVNFCLK